ncbi:GCN5-related protein N-acetyltransferase [Beutenbergia cavernae DSM 12333]|uniref:GCN5-related protein N-acetyltransferase n=1 Tax=Beutenbergia cavernae (strain ATCC BAA-8 / DSM 12333 / CCUG 43141 / JCM 11478 / NBRC 16432 / NCIMB 13614 / HKI 0122) TaxID=471853 RepID=C5BUX7_BEUC1|nr:GNAT family protein [Beutenbergia cavernae]ACQ78351.1 GCN5-related protein N-acetyltransferase [Beutenbergia cavernae DSM 12333]
MPVELRPWRPEDAPHLRRARATSPDLATQLGAVDLSTDEACSEFIAGHLGLSTTATHHAIVSDGVVVGNVGLTHIDRRHDTAWVSYWLSAAARGRGLAAPAAATVARWAFRDLDLYRLELGHRLNNPASCRVATAAGFVPEGVERAKLRYGDERFDVETHARLRTDVPPALEKLSFTPPVPALSG